MAKKLKPVMVDAETLRELQQKASRADLSTKGLIAANEEIERLKLSLNNKDAELGNLRKSFEDACAQAQLAISQTDEAIIARDTAVTLREKAERDLAWTQRILDTAKAERDTLRGEAEEARKDAREARAAEGRMEQRLERLQNVQRELDRCLGWIAHAKGEPPVPPLPDNAMPLEQYADRYYNRGHFSNGNR